MHQSPFGVLDQLGQLGESLPLPHLENRNASDEPRLQRPASAPSNRHNILKHTMMETLRPKKYSLNRNRLSSQDWSKVIDSLKGGSGRFQFLRKGSFALPSSVLYNRSPIANENAQAFLVEYEQKKKDDARLFEEQIRLDRESDQLLLRRCIQECNEFCELLKRPVNYQYHNDSFVRKSKLDNRGALGSRQIMTNRFFTEHSKLLQEYKNRLRGKAGAEPLLTSTTSQKNSMTGNSSGNGNGSSIFNLTSDGTGNSNKATDTNPVSHQQRKDKSYEEKHEGGRSSPGRRRSSTNADSTMGYNVDDLLNELQRRKDVCAIQESILTTMEEEEDSIFEQIQFIRSKGWNL